MAIKDSDGEELDITELQPTKTRLSEELDRLKRASIDALSKRETVPQPLFWSLFHSELAQLKRRKHLERFIQGVFEEAGRTTPEGVPAPKPNSKN